MVLLPLARVSAVAHSDEMKAQIGDGKGRCPGAQKAATAVSCY